MSAATGSQRARPVLDAIQTTQPAK